MKIFRCIIGALCLAVLLIGEGRADNLQRQWDNGVPASGYKAFKIRSGGRDLGFQYMSFERDGDALRIAIHVELDVYVGPFRVFTYTHKNEENWRDGRLVAIRSRTDNNGKEAYVDMQSNGAMLEGRASGYKGAVPATVLSTNYFNPNFVDSTQVLSTQEGNLIELASNYIGTETVIGVDGAVETEHFRTTGRLDLDLWYTPQGEWVRATFVRQGRKVIYEPVTRDALPPRNKWRKVE